MKMVTSELDPSFTSSVLGYGTYHLLDRVFEADAIESFSHAYDFGVAFIDTSDNYLNEEVIGKAISMNGLGSMTIATKTGLATTYKEFCEMRLQRRRVDLSPERMERQLDRSIEALGRTSIDLYQAHAFDDYTPLSSVAETMTRFVEAGKVSHWGVSNFTAQQLEELLTVCDAYRLLPPVTFQPQWSIFSGRSVDKTIEIARDAKMVILAHSPLMKGLLTESGVDLIEAVLSDKDAGAISPDIRPKVQATLDRLFVIRDYANKQGYSLSEFALAWLANQPQTVVLSACVDEDHLRSSVQAMQWQIPQDGIDLVDEIRSDHDAVIGAHMLAEAVEQTKPYYAKRTS